MGTMAEADSLRARDTACQSAQTLAPEDYYIENGFTVFTAGYHLKRGYCCNSGCRHCPYRVND